MDKQATGVKINRFIKSVGQPVIPRRLHIGDGDAFQLKCNLN